jgi:hypothetical protein
MLICKAELWTVLKVLGVQLSTAQPRKSKRVLWFPPASPKGPSGEESKYGDLGRKVWLVEM